MILVASKERFLIQAQITDFIGVFLLRIEKVRSKAKKLSKPLRKLERIKQAIRKGVQRLIEHLHPRRGPVAT